MNDLPLLTSFQAKPLLAALQTGAGAIGSSVDLNRSEVQAEVTPEGVRFPEDLIVAWNVVRDISEEERRVFAIVEGKAVPIQVFSEETGWVRTLCATEP